MTYGTIKEPINLLWSGGFDSTYRLIELTVIHRRVVRPVYIVDMCGRPKQELESAARAEIMKLLPLSARRQLVESVGIPHVDWWPLYEMWQKRLELNSDRVVGQSMSPQAPAMPAAASAINEDVECCYVALDQANDVAVMNHMAGVAFPLRYLTKQTMLETATRAGMRPVLDMTWSCEWTDGSGTCGECIACKSRILEQKVLT